MVVLYGRLVKEKYPGSSGDQTTRDTEEAAHNDRKLQLRGRSENVLPSMQTGANCMTRASLFNSIQIMMAAMLQISDFFRETSSGEDSIPMTHLIETALDTPSDRMLRKMKGGDQVEVIIAQGKAGKSLHVIQTGSLLEGHVTQ